MFLVVPTPVRLARLRKREGERDGQQAIAPGGGLHGAHVEFLDWASRYDTVSVEMRSRALHEQWVATLPCPVIRLEGDFSAGDQLGRIIANLGAGLPHFPR